MGDCTLLWKNKLVFVGKHNKLKMYLQAANSAIYTGTSCGTWSLRMV